MYNIICDLEEDGKCIWNQQSSAEDNEIIHYSHTNASDTLHVGTELLFKKVVYVWNMYV